MAGGQQLPLRPLATAGGVAGHSWVLGQAVPGEVVELGLPRGWVPPSACAPLGLRLLEASTVSPVDPVYLREQRTETSVAAGDREAARVQMVHSLKERQRLQNGLCGSVRKRTGAETAVAEGSALGHSPVAPGARLHGLVLGRGRSGARLPVDGPPAPLAAWWQSRAPSGSARCSEKLQVTRATITPMASGHGSARPWTSHGAHKR